MTITRKYAKQYKYYIKNKCTDEYILRQRNYRIKMRNKILETAGGAKCCKCGFTDIRALQIDHVNGGGRKENLNRNSLKRIVTTIKENPNKYQVLCANCNWIKKHENNETNSTIKRGLPIKNSILYRIK